MSTKLNELKSKLETLKKGLTNPNLKTNPQLKKSLEKKIFELQDEIDALEKPKVAEKTKQAEVKKQPTKKETVKEEKKPIISKNVKVGDTVTFFHKKSGENKKGSIVSLKKSYSYADKIIVTIKTNKGEKFETYEHLVEKI
jgi:hypothetical protein